MSDHVSRSYADCEGKSSKPTRPYQSMWMGHWGGTSCNTGIARQVDSGLSLRLESSGDQVDTKHLHVPLKDEPEPSSQRLALSFTNFPETDGSANKFAQFPATSSTGEHLGKTNNPGWALAIPFTDNSYKLIKGIPHPYEKEKMSSFFSRYKSKEHFSSTDLTNMGHTAPFSVPLCEGKIDNDPSSRKLDSPMFPYNPSSSKTELPMFTGQQFNLFKDMQNFSKIRTEASSQCQECYALPGNKHCMHKLKTSKILATSDSTEEFDDPARNSFPLVDTLLSTQSKLDIFGKFLKFTSGGGGGLFREKSGVKLQLLSSSSDSDGKCSNKDNPQPQLLKNESSAETDTMDMEALREQNVLSGLNSSVQNKDHLVEGATFFSLLKKDKQIQAMTQNLVSSTHFAKELPNPLRLNPRPYMVDPGSRWLKRLKLINVSDYLVLGTKRSNPQEQQPPPFFLRENNKRQKSKVDEKASRKEEKANIAQGRDTLLSHAWIQRWCRNKAVDTIGKIGNEVIRKPKKFKLDSEEFETKQFPSIGAMALMGKTLTGARTLKLIRKGSSVVWNA